MSDPLASKLPRILLIAGLILFVVPVPYGYLADALFASANADDSGLAGIAAALFLWPLALLVMFISVWLNRKQKLRSKNIEGTYKR